MPHFKIRYVAEELALARSGRLTARLAEAIGCDAEWLKLELEPTRRVRDGGFVASEPYVEVHWFERPEPVKRAVAAILAEELKGDADYLAVEFVAIPADGYYENGERFG
ncbi:MAG: DUF1904 domain-containing protein [Spirochaetes bacterium]|nr:DUF1904 domain-containing protein [Spirochaetota bacterium]MBU1082329.1 DUF1904 domain-containing protein [Spirochaetota bacterium]